MKTKAVAAALLSLCLSGPAAANLPSPPQRLSLDPFYQQYLDASGIPVVRSAQVPEAAMQAARDIVATLLAHRPDLRGTLIRSGARVGVMAQSETTTDLPEQRHWKKPAIDDPRLSKCDVRDYATTIGRMSDRDYWDARARGLGGLYTTGAAENLMAVPGTRDYGENILVHEFSHNILNAIRTTDPALTRHVEAAFQNAKAKGLWRAAYMALNVDEYRAEGTQFWFNSNMAYNLDALVVVNDADLKRHDPPLYAVLAEVYGRNHQIRGDAFYRHAARLNSRPADLKNDCYS